MIDCSRKTNCVVRSCLDLKWTWTHPADSSLMEWECAFCNCLRGCVFLHPLVAVICFLIPQKETERLNVHRQSVYFHYHSTCHRGFRSCNYVWLSNNPYRFKYLRKVAKWCHFIYVTLATSQLPKLSDTVIHLHTNWHFFWDTIFIFCINNGTHRVVEYFMYLIFSVTYLNAMLLLKDRKQEDRKWNRIWIQMCLDSLPPDSKVRSPECWHRRQNFRAFGHSHRNPPCFLLLWSNTEV